MLGDLETYAGDYIYLPVTLTPHTVTWSIKPSLQCSCTSAGALFQLTGSELNVLASGCFYCKGTRLGLWHTFVFNFFLSISLTIAVCCIAP